MLTPSFNGKTFAYNANGLVWYVLARDGLQECIYELNPNYLVQHLDIFSIVLDQRGMDWNDGALIALFNYHPRNNK